MYPADCKYAKNHEFVKPLGDGTALVGISQYAQEALGDVVFVQVPEVGASFAAGDEFGTVESVKTVSECYMPVAGEVVEVNQALADEPSLANSDPEGAGWFFKVKLSQPDQVAALMDEAAYKAFAA